MLSDIKQWEINWFIPFPVICSFLDSVPLTFVSQHSTTFFRNKFETFSSSSSSSSFLLLAECFCFFPDDWNIKVRMDGSENVDVKSSFVLSVFSTHFYVCVCVCVFLFLFLFQRVSIMKGGRGVEIFEMKIYATLFLY